MKGICFLIFVIVTSFGLSQKETDTLSLSYFKSIKKELEKESNLDSFNIANFLESKQLNAFEKKLFKGIHYYYKEQHFSAIKHFSEISEHPKKEFVAPVQAWLYFLSSLSYTGVRSGDMALRSLNQVQEIQTDEFDPFRIGLIKAICWAELSQRDSAAYYFDYCLSISKTFEDTMFVYYNGLVSAPNKADNYSGIAELEYVKDRISLVSKSSDSLLTVLCLHQLISYNISNESYDKAENVKLLLDEYTNVAKFSRVYPQYLLSSIMLDNRKTGVSNLYDSLINEYSNPSITNEVIYEMYREMLNYEYDKLNKTYTRSALLDSLHKYVNKKEENQLKVITEINKQFTFTLEDNLLKTGEKLEVEASKNEILYKNNRFYFYIIILVVCLSLAVLLILRINYRNRKIKNQRQLEFLRNEKELNEINLSKQNLELELSQEKVKIRENDLRHLQELINVKTDVSNDIVNGLNQIKSKVEGEAKQEINQFIFSLKGVNDAENEQLALNKDSDLYSSEMRQKVSKMFPNLNEAEIKLCNLLILGFDTKSIAKIRNVRTESILTSKYRLKKKMNLSKESNLDTFLRETFE